MWTWNSWVSHSPAHPLLHGLPADHQFAGSICSFTRPGIRVSVTLGVVVLDRVDESAVLLGVLQVDPDRADLPLGVHSAPPFGGAPESRWPWQLAASSRRTPLGGGHHGGRACGLREPLGVGLYGLAGLRIPAVDDLAEHLRGWPRRARASLAHALTAALSHLRWWRTSRGSAGRAGCRRPAPRNRARSSRCSYSRGYSDCIDQVEADHPRPPSRARPVALPSSAAGPAAAARRASSSSPRPTCRLRHRPAPDRPG